MTNFPWYRGELQSRLLPKLGMKSIVGGVAHIILRRKDPPHRRLVIPDHQEIARGTLRSLIREAGLTPDEFSALL